jgi:hypothetical protein
MTLVRRAAKQKNALDYHVEGLGWKAFASLSDGQPPQNVFPLLRRLNQA